VSRRMLAIKCKKCGCEFVGLHLCTEGGTKEDLEF
jgi:hypothetical protein